MHVANGNEPLMNHNHQSLQIKLQPHHQITKATCLHDSQLYSRLDFSSSTELRYWQLLFLALPSLGCLAFQAIFLGVIIYADINVWCGELPSPDCQGGAKSERQAQCLPYNVCNTKPQTRLHCTMSVYNSVWSECPLVSIEVLLQYLYTA